MTQDKPINAQVVLSREGLKVMRITIAKGATLAEHCAPTDVIVTVMRGKGIFTLQGEAKPITAGDVIDLKPNALHAVAANEELELIVVKMELKQAIK